MKTGAWLLLLAVSAGALLAGMGPGWLNANLFALLPVPQRNPQVAAALKRVQQATTNQALILTVADKPGAAARAARAYASTLQGSDLFAKADAGLPFNAEDAARFYHQYRYHLLSPGERRRLRKNSVEKLTHQALRRAYAGPGEASGREIASDPLGLFRSTLSAMKPPGAWRLVGGTPVRRTKNGYAGVVHAVLAVSPFALSYQKPLSGLLSKASQAARKQGHVKVLTAGVLWHALAQGREAHSEISTIGYGSMAGVILLILLVFRSPRPLVIGALSLGTGALVALAVTRWIFGYVHLFALIFGASLIGVAADYTLHIFADRFSAVKDWTPARAVSRLLPGLLLALATSVLGYAALAIPALPGLRQVACFSAVGLIAAWLTVMLLMPRWGGAGGPRRPPAPARWSDGALRHLHARPLLVGFCLLAVAIPGWVGTHYSDNVGALRLHLPQRAAMEQRVRTILGAADASQFFLVTASDKQALLQREARLGKRLRRLSGDGKLERWRGIAQSVPPLAQQKKNYRLLKKKVFGAKGAAPAAWRRLGFSQNHIRDREQDFRQAASHRLTLDKWLSSPVSRQQRRLWLGHLGGGELASVVLLGGVNDLAALEAIQLPGVRLANPVAEYTDVMATQRRHMQWFLLAAYALVAALLMGVYGWRGGLATVAPPLAASAVAIAALGWTGQPLDLFVLFALFLLLGVGVDYAIFLREAEIRGRGIGDWSAVCLCALTTLLSFGLLALSATPAIHRFGFTLLIGIVAAWVFSPLGRLKSEKKNA